MFEKFTRAARMTVHEAVVEAEKAMAPAVTEQHLFLALLARRDTRAAAILAGAEITRDKVTTAYREADRQAGLTDTEAEALRGLGIDVDEVVARIENSLGENALAGPLLHKRGHRPFSAAAKRVLHGALREARARNERELGDEHLLLALATNGEVAAQLLAANGLGYVELRARLAKAS
jgi:ATP-dependent Clp protease ATP-binding subunit ClpA